MDAKYVSYARSGAVVRITVNRPDVLNAISRRVYAELDDAFTRAEDDDGVKVVVVAGAGAHFGAGHDLGTAEMRSELEEFPRDNSKLGRVKAMDSGVFWRLHDRWRNLGKPTIAMVQGYCIMGSWMLASACDLIVAADNAKFADRSVRWGGAHHEYPTHFWELGIRKAKEYLWTGDFIDAHEAHRLGMVNRVVPVDELESATSWLASRIALNDLLGLKLSKMSINQAADIQGQSAAVRASGNFWIIAAARNSAGTRDDAGAGGDAGAHAHALAPARVDDRVGWSKSQNEAFDEHERRTPRPW